MLTLDQLRSGCAHAPGGDLPFLNAAMDEASIASAIEQAHFLGQLAVECMGFTVFTERWGPTSDQIHYERPIVNGAPAPLVDGPHQPLWQRLGNLNPGDGRKYAGHGGIQVTGKANHAACGAALGLNLVDYPELAALPENRYRVSAWFWKQHGLGALAADGDVVGITRIINGLGMYGLEDRKAFTAKFMTALGAVPECA